MKKEAVNSRPETVLRGVGGSPGVAVGPVYRIHSEEAPLADHLLSPEETAGEIQRFKVAVKDTRRQIVVIQKNVRRAIGQYDANIFDMHMMILEDPAFFEETIRRIELERLNAGAAVRAVTNRYSEVLSAMEDEYLRERVSDVRDVVRRVLRNLAGETLHALDGLKSKSIVVAQDLSPSETAALRRGLVMGFVTDLGSATSHTAIMAKALGIPAVVGLGNVSAQVANDDLILIDGTEGVVILNPSEASLKKYNKLARHRKFIQSGLKQLRDAPAETKDGHRVVLSANLELVEEVADVKKFGAEGVGLFRSEYLYIARQDLPVESEQLAAYQKVVSLLAPKPVIIRTVDLGGDKFASSVKMSPEINPFLGFRAIRFCLAQPAIFKTQLRAILRASAHGKVRIMYPMISNVNEVIRANVLLEECKTELRGEGLLFDEKIEVGVMIEIPSAALTADIIAKHVSFFSLGTNDLVQYTLAVDRVNDRVSYLYEPTHPAVLRLMKRTIDAGHDHGIWVGICGQMAGDPLMTLLLLGLGIDELSMVASAVPAAKDMIRSVVLSQAQELARMALAAETAAEVLQLCYDLTAQVAPEILELTK
ncbi:MAG: phosphoenolpyruvate--protein phosphotransferase [bacterium]